MFGFLPQEVIANGVVLTREAIAFNRKLLCFQIKEEIFAQLPLLLPSAQRRERERTRREKRTQIEDTVLLPISSSSGYSLAGAQRKGIRALHCT